MKLYEDTFWGRVKERMQVQGMSLRTLCDRAGLIYSTTTNQITLGKMPKKDGNIKRIAEVLCTSIEYLTTGHGAVQVGEDPEISNLVADYLFLNNENRETVRILVKGLMNRQINDNRIITEKAEKGC